MHARVDVSKTPAFEVGLVAGQRKTGELHTSANVKVFRLNSQVGIRVRKSPLLILLGTYLLVFLRYKDVTLNTSRHGNLPVIRLCGGAEWQCQQ